jgi:ketosteroid isomerase-like protein
MLDKPTKLPDVYKNVKVTFDGGSEKDRQDVLMLYHTYMLANDHVDFDLLKTVWDDNPDNLFFNTNQFTYEGLSDWENIWNYYRPKFKLESPYYPGRLRVVIRDDMAFVASDGIKRFKSWVGGAQNFHNPPDYRSTKVLLKDKGGKWRVVHSHFSVGPEEGQIRPDKSEKTAARA